MTLIEEYKKLYTINEEQKQILLSLIKQFYFYQNLKIIGTNYICKYIIIIDNLPEKYPFQK